MSWFASNLPREKHCFFDASGGFSTGIYQSFNVSISSQDNPQNVRKNLEKAAAYFGLKPENLNMLKQGVSAHPEYVSEAKQWQVTADGAVTDKPDVILCIRTADCAPVLLEDRQNGVIGAAHAGWRGAFAGIIENVVRLMIEKGACLENIAAAIGPCIGQDSYEVDSNFYRQFLDKNRAFAKYFVDGKRANFYQFDLEEFCADRLKDCGLCNISRSGKDTYILKDEYYSFRRFTHQGIVKKPKCFATELSAIVL